MAQPLKKLRNLGIREGDSVMLRENKRALNGINLLLILGGLLGAFFYLSLEFTVWETYSGSVSLIPLTLALLLPLNLLVHHLTGRLALSVNITATLALLLPAFLQIKLGGFLESGGVLLLSSFAPVGALLFLRLRSAIVWLGLFVLTIIGTTFFVYILAVYFGTVTLMDVLDWVARPEDVGFLLKNSMLLTHILLVTAVNFLLINSFLARNRKARKEILAQSATLSEKNEELQVQEEELRQNLEELESQQEELTRVKKEMENVQRAIFRSTAVIEFDLKGNILSANDNFLQTMGYTIDEIEGKHHQIFVTEDYAQSSEYAEFWNYLGAGNFHQQEAQRVAKDGSEVWLQASYNPVIDQHGKPYKVIKIATDITEKKKQDIAIQEHNEQLMAKEEQLRQNLEEMQAQQDELQRVQDELRENEKNLQDLNQNLEQRVQERTKELEEAMTELRSTQTKMVENEKMATLGNLVAGVAHEINTPVGIAVTAGSHLQDTSHSFQEKIESGKLKKSDLNSFLSETNEASEIILKNLDRASQLVQSFKQVAVNQSNEMTEEFNLHTYIGQIVTSMRPKLKKTKLEVQNHIPEDLNVNSIPSALSQIFINFITNSIRYAYEPEDVGTLAIHAHTTGEHVVLSYSDDGKGIPKENLSKVFDPFFTTGRGSGGSGLGLNIVYNLVTQKLKGDIQVDSEVGRGTTFTLTIPINVNEASDVASDDAAEGDSSKEPNAQEA